MLSIQCFHKKDEWQKATFNSIKKDLISAKEQKFLRYDNSKEEHLVMIYGKSQVGKTTLILNMIGLDEKYFQEVYDTLRAGVPLGNSSTSTSIIYTKSINEKYGCTVGSAFNLETNKIEYFDKNGMIEYLKLVRNNVEKNITNKNDILYIYIPCNYFIQDNTTNNISIIDMPGIESRNHKEDRHVQNILAKYIPISSVCIIACRANDIQSLETTILPKQINWKEMSHRFLLVITHAYNNGNIKQYFNNKKSERKTDFYKYVTEIYASEVKKVLGKDNKTEVYPIDVGNTLENLCVNEIKNNDDINEIKKTKDKILSELRISILKHKGDKLKHVLEDLNSIVKRYGIDDIDDINNNIKKNEIEICNFKNQTEKCNNYILAIQSDLNALRSQDNQLELKSKELNKLLYQKNFDLFIEVEHYTKNKELINKNHFLKDKQKNLGNFIRNLIDNFITEYSREVKKIINDIQNVNTNIDIRWLDIINEINTTTMTQMENSLYPPKEVFFKKRKKVYEDEIKCICKETQNSINNSLKNLVQKPINDYIKRRKYDLNNEKEEKEKLTNKFKKSIESYNSKINELTEKNTSLFIEKNKIETDRKKDKSTLKKFLDYAHMEYIKQRNFIIEQINKSKTVDDKIILILLLGLLDNDYKNVVGSDIDGK